MKIVSNQDFSVLVADQSSRLRALAKQRCEDQPSGFVTLSDLDAIIKLSAYCGDHAGQTWLKNLRKLATSGKLAKVRQGADKWENKVLLVEAMQRKGEIAFKIGDSVMVKESGKYAQVIDYSPEDKEFLVLLDPFQVKQFKSKDLERVASTCAD